MFQAWSVAIGVVCGWVLSVCLHEFGHAIVAYYGGDRSVKEKGYLTLNPLKYTDPTLSLVLPVVFLLMGGIGLPGGAVYIDHSRLRGRFWRSAVSAGGPLASAIVALLLGIVYRDGAFAGFPELEAGIAFLIVLEISSVLLNLLPIPTFDGYGIIEPWLPLEIQGQLQAFRRYGLLVVIGLFWFCPPFVERFWEAVFRISQGLEVSPDIAFMGYTLFREQSPILIILMLGLAALLRRRHGFSKSMPSQQRSSSTNNRATAASLKPRTVQLFERGNELFEQEQFEEAIALYQAVLQIDADFYQAWFQQLRAYRALGREEAALQACEQVLISRPEDCSLWWYKAQISTALGREPEAIAAYEKAIAIEPEFYGFWLGYSHLLFQLQRTDEAILACDRALELKPQEARIWNLRGMVLLENKQLSRAEQTYQGALTWCPRVPELWINLGMTQLKLQKIESAIASIQAGLALERDRADALYNLACCYAQLEQITLATTMLRKAIVRAPHLTKFASSDPDFEPIRADSRFREIVSHPSR